MLFGKNKLSLSLYLSERDRELEIIQIFISFILISTDIYYYNLVTHTSTAPINLPRDAHTCRTPRSLRSRWRPCLSSSPQPRCSTNPSVSPRRSRGAALRTGRRRDRVPPRRTDAEMGRRPHRGKTMTRRSVVSARGGLAAGGRGRAVPPQGCGRTRRRRRRTAWRSARRDMRTRHHACTLHTGKRWK